MAAPSPTPCPLCAAAATAAFLTVGGRAYRRCPACWLTFLEPHQRPDAAAERAEYALHRNDPGDPAYRRFLAQAIDPLAAHLAPGAKGLDFGCGPGPAVPAMLGERGWRVRVYDPVFAPDAEALERTYDFIVCTEVAEHFHNPGAEFARLDRLLRPGGRLSLMTGVLRDDAGFAGWGYRRELSHVVFYRPETLAWIAAHFHWAAEAVGRNVTLFHKAAGDTGTSRLA